MKNNPFADHGVEYLSPTSINKFRKNPAKWLVNIAGYKDRFYSPAMSYGTCIEQGITHGCFDHNASVDDCINATDLEYKKIYNKIIETKADYDFDACTKKREMTRDTIEAMLPLFRSFGTPTDAQLRVEHEIDDLPIPMIGYIDLLYKDCVRDIKTTGIQPKPKKDYQYQLSFYAKATGVTPIVDCIYSLKTKKELQSFEVSDIEKNWNEIKRIANKMMRLLSLSSDISEVCYLSCLEPDISNEDFTNQWGTNEIIGANKLFFERG